MTRETKKKTKINYKLNNFLFLSNLVIHANNYTNTKHIVIADTGATGHCNGVKNGINSKTILNPISVLLPSGGHMTSTHIRSLNIPSLPSDACTQHLFPEMKTTGLSSLVQLCDHGYTEILSHRCIVIRDKYDTIVMMRHTQPQRSNGMRIINLDNSRPPNPSFKHATPSFCQKQQQKYLAQFHHVSLGFPVKATLIDATNAGFLASFPGLTKKIIRKHLPKSETTCRGHMDQERKNLQLTKTKTLSTAPPIVTWLKKDSI